jgi:hypothetical protein
MYVGIALAIAELGKRRDPDPGVGTLQAAAGGYNMLEARDDE